jgi:hypothetical protein
MRTTDQGLLGSEDCSSAGLSAKHVGYIVSLGGGIGAACMLFAGGYADRRGDRFLNAFWYSILFGGAFLVIGPSHTPAAGHGVSGVRRDLLHHPDADRLGMG